MYSDPIKDKQTLLSMGFPLDRVEWAIMDTPLTSGLQARVDHILEHEQELPPVASFPVPSFSASNTPTPAQLPPSNNMYYTAPPGPPPTQMWSSVSTAPNLAASFAGLNVNTPPNHAKLPFVTSQDPRSALERFEAILAEEQTMRESLYEDRKEMGIKVYKMMKDFFDEELSKRRVEYGLSLMDVGETPAVPPTNKSNNPFVPRVEPERPPPLPLRQNTDPLRAVSMLGAANAAQTPLIHSTPPNTQPPPNLTWTRDPNIYDPCAVYYPNRVFIPPSKELANVLSSVTGQFESSRVIQESRSALPTLRSGMEGKLSELRFAQSPSDSSSISAPGGDEQQRRGEEHSQKISHLYSTSQFEAASRLEKEYQDYEKQLIRENKEREFEQWKQQYWTPARDHLVTELGKVFAEYAILEVLLKTEVGTAPGQVSRIKLDALEAVRALEQIADLRDRVGYEGLDDLEDEVRQRDHALKVEAALDAAERAGTWGTSEILDNKKELQDSEAKQERTKSKVQRKSTFYELTINALSTALAQVEEDKTALVNCLQSIRASIPETLTFGEEEAEQKAGNQTAIQTALPSMELINQLYSATEKIALLAGIAEDIHREMHTLRQKETREIHEQVMAELVYEETKAGRGAQVLLGRGKVLRDRAEQEDERLEAEYRDRVKVYRERTSEATEPIQQVLRRYKDGETSVRARLMQRLVDVGGTNAPLGGQENISNIYRNR